MVTAILPKCGTDLTSKQDSEPKMIYLIDIEEEYVDVKIERCV